MNKSPSFSVSTFVLIACAGIGLCGSTAVAAAIIDAEISGIFVDGADNNNTLGLGTQTPVSLFGRSVVVRFSYDTALVPLGGSSGPGLFYYQTPNELSTASIDDGWLSEPTVLIDGVLAPRPTAFAHPNGVPRKSIHIQGGDPGFFILFYQNSSVSESGEIPHGLTNFQIDLAFPLLSSRPQSPINFLPTQPLDETFRPNQSGQVVLGDTSNHTGGTGAYGIFAGFAVSRAVLTLRPVPLPTGAWMLAPALCLLVARCRSSKNQNRPASSGQKTRRARFQT